MICSASSVPESALVFEFEASRFEKRWVSPVFHFSFPGWAELSHIGGLSPSVLRMNGRVFNRRLNAGGLVPPEFIE